MLIESEAFTYNTFSFISIMGVFNPFFGNSNT